MQNMAVFSSLSLSLSIDPDLDLELILQLINPFSCKLTLDVGIQNSFEDSNSLCQSATSLIPSPVLIGADYRTLHKLCLIR